MKKMLFAVMSGLVLLTLSACAGTGVDNSSTRVDVAKVQEKIDQGRMGLAVAQVAFAVVPVCDPTDKTTTTVCITQATQTKVLGYASLAQAALATASTILQTNPNDPASVTAAVTQALQAVNKFVSAVNGKST